MSSETFFASLALGSVLALSSSPRSPNTTANLLLAEELVLTDLWLWSRAAWMDLPVDIRPLRLMTSPGINVFAPLHGHKGVD